LGGGGKHRKSEYETLENNYGRVCRKGIKTGTNGKVDRVYWREKKVGRMPRTDKNGKV
jgi:hypothetical protein